MLIYKIWERETLDVEQTKDEKLRYIKVVLTLRI